MARALTYSAKSMQRINRVVQEVEGVPLQAVRRRARWPIAGGPDTVVAYITQDNGSGDNQCFFTSIAGGTEPFACNTAADGSGSDRDVYWSHNVPGVHFTGQCIWIQRLQDAIGGPRRWETVLPGATAWYGVPAIDGDIISGAGFASLPYWRCSPSGVFSLDHCTVPVVAGDVTFFVSEADGQLCDVMFDQSSGQFVVTGVYCPGA